VIVVSDRPWCFAVRTDPKLLLIVVSDRPWCFATRIDPMLRSLYLTGMVFFNENRSNGCVVQVFDEFLTGVEVLFNCLVICILCSKLFQLEGEY
jgi:hypothetical protein